LLCFVLIRSKENLPIMIQQYFELAMQGVKKTSKVLIALSIPLAHYWQL